MATFRPAILKRAGIALVVGGLVLLLVYMLWSPGYDLMDKTLRLVQLLPGLGSLAIIFGICMWSVGASFRDPDSVRTEGD